MMNNGDENLENKVYKAVSRLSEFYDKDYLYDFQLYCQKEELPLYKSVLFLDGQTRADYYVNQRNPKIWDYMKRTKHYFRGAE